MKNLIILSSILLTTLFVSAKEPTSTYRYVVQFNSQCCGVPDAAPLFKCIAVFKKKNKIKKIAYVLISPMGREGEYYMAFSLSELSKKQVTLFIQQIDATTVLMKDKGTATTQQNMVIDKASLSPRTSFTKKII